MARGLLLLAVASAIAASFAPVAGADQGVVGGYKFNKRFCSASPCHQNDPGFFGGANALGINSTGAGGAGVKDLYVFGFSTDVTARDSRVQHFSANGDFKRLWGLDVVASGPGNSSEVQGVMVEATGGTFTLGFGGETTGPLDHDATAAAVEDALEALGTLSVSVSGGPGDATGSAPYLVTFAEASGGVDQPLLSADGSSLSGDVSVYTINAGEVGAEICRPEIGDTCKAAAPTAPGTGSTGNDATFVGGVVEGLGDISVDQETGDVFIAATGRVNAFSASGEFLRAWGGDVVRAGPGDSDVDEVQRLTVRASGGAFTLGFRGATTGPIPYNASAATVESAIDGLPTVGGVYGSVSVSGGPGDAIASSPYTVVFGGVLGGDDVAALSANGADLSGSGSFATVATVSQGGGFEVCTAVDACKTSGSGVAGGNFASLFEGIATAPEGAPNAGNVLALDHINYRVQEFTAGGDFVRAFGWDVVATGPGDSAVDEQQEVTVKATGGKFSLAFKGATTGAEGVGIRAANSNVLTNVGANVGTTNGSFAVGQIVTGAGIPAGTTITAVNPTTLELSADATSGGAGTSTNLVANDLDFDATPAEVETALNALPTIGDAGGSVDVSGGPGDLAGSSPYQIAFDGSLAGDNVPALTSSTSGLTITSGSPAITVATLGQGGAFEVCRAASGDVCQAGTSGGTVPANNLPGMFAQNNGQVLQAVEVDSTGAVYTVEGDCGTAPCAGFRVQKFTPQAGTPELLPSVFGGPGAPNGSSRFDTPRSIAIGPDDEVLVAKRFPAGAATCPGGSPSPAEIRIQTFDPSGALIETSRPCAGIPVVLNDGGLVPKPKLAADLSTGEPYVLFHAALPEDEVPGVGVPPRVYVLGEVGAAPTLDLNDPADVTSTRATISGEIDSGGPAPNGYPVPAATTYRVEYKKSADSSWTVFAPDAPLDLSAEPEPFSVGLGGLTPSTEYDARVVVQKPFGFQALVGPTQTFTTTTSPPRVVAFSSSHVLAGSADLHATINPQGIPTTYHFEYGTTPAYGKSTPEQPVGDSHGPISVEAHIEGLDPVVQHFRVVATNAAGTTTSHNQTFSFYPEPCPNAIARQQTGSGSLPDCRAYEIVSPGSAGSVTFVPRGPSSPTATNPARLGYAGGFGTVQGVPGNPPPLGTLYVSTRTNTGWRTRHVGIEADRSVHVGTHPLFPDLTEPTRTSDPTLSKFLDWDRGSVSDVIGGSFAPFMWDAEGNSLGRLPTNLAQIPNGDAVLEDGGFVGDVRPSGDLSHYFFSSANVAFAPGGLTSGSGSVYDNDIEAGTVELASKLPDGSHIPEEQGDATDHDFMQVPGASVDGSRILIGTLGSGVCGVPACPAPLPDICPASLQGRNLLGALLLGKCPFGLPAHLYMRVNGSITYDVSKGRLVRYAGMTGDASRVYFTSAQRLTADDTDTSTDLFVWSEATDSLTRLSVGDTGSIGNTDACSSSWVAKCGVEVVPVGPEASAPLDNSIAAEAGDVWFYSPEQLDDAEGVPAKRNLYVYRGGEAHFVATLEPNLPVGRIQVSPDGDHAAFITASQLTAYDNTSPDGMCKPSVSQTDEIGEPTGPRCWEMYSYDVESEELRCVSCLPSGEPPSNNVWGSKSGIFMSNDGRTFFATRDALVPQDTNGEIVDVYEYVNGRPQLLTSGTGDVTTSFGTFAGLLGVSADGVNAYFSTLDTLVAQDNNGPFLKMYVARTNGGFPVAAQPAPCKAADECHNADSTPIPTPRIASGADLGSGGNARPATKTKKKQSRPKKKQRRRAKRCAKRAGKAAGKTKKAKRGCRATKRRSRAGGRAGK